MRYLKFLLVLFLLYSCGSRKVEKHSKSRSESITATELSNTDVTVLQLTKEQFSSLIFELEIRGDLLTKNSEGETHIQNPVINLKGTQETSSKNDSLKTDIQNQIKAEVDIKTNEDESDKNTEKEQFSWWLYVFIVIVFILLMYKNKSMM